LADTLAIATRLGLYLDLMILFGVPLFGIYGLRGVEYSQSTILALRTLYALGAAIGIALSALSIVVLAASMSGASVGEVTWDTIALFVGETMVGWSFVARISALVIFLTAALLLDPARGVGRLLLVVLGAVGLASLAWTGHAAADQGAVGQLHLGADIIHLLAAGAWISAILGLGALLFRRTRSMSHRHIAVSHAALTRFAVIGSIAVALLVATGLVNSWLIVGLDGIAAFGTSLYLQLLALKLLFFVAMLGLAALNRFRLTPALERVARSEPAAAVWALRRSLVIEATLGIAIVALVAWFGTLAPPSAL
jgi:putative copper resistance protein D